jgi:hypothetical protein
MRSVQVALVAGLGLLLAGLVAVAMKHPDEVARGSVVSPEAEVASIVARTRLCQAGEVVPKGSTAIVAWLEAFTGPRVSAEVIEGGQIVGRGQHGSGWAGRSVTIPLSRPSPGSSDATVCFIAAPRDEGLIARGGPVNGPARLTENGRLLQGRMATEYLRPGRRTWLSLAAPIARHLGLGRLPSGMWAPITTILLMAAAIVVLVRSIVHGLR